LTQNTLKVPKTRKEVKLWVHPEGLVIGSLFVREQGENRSETEAPHQVMNQESPFVVLYLNKPSELRFYNRNSIIRVEYDDEVADSAQKDIIPCRLTLMDGSLIDGEIRESLPPDYSRLFDYLNQGSERFIRLYIENNQICLINKSYINHVTTEQINNN
jgi:hypothetical protein